MSFLYSTSCIVNETFTGNITMNIINLTICQTFLAVQSCKFFCTLTNHIPSILNALSTIFTHSGVALGNAPFTEITMETIWAGAHSPAT